MMNIDSCALFNKLSDNPTVEEAIKDHGKLGILSLPT